MKNRSTGNPPSSPDGQYAPGLHSPADKINLQNVQISKKSHEPSIVSPVLVENDSGAII